METDGIKECHKESDGIKGCHKESDGIKGMPQSDHMHTCIFKGKVTCCLMVCIQRDHIHTCIDSTGSVIQSLCGSREM